MHTIIIQNDYAVASARLWALVTEVSRFQQAMRGVVAFEALPGERIERGQRFLSRRSTLGLRLVYDVEVLACDHERLILRETHGRSGKQIFKHTLAVTPAADGSRLTDKIEVEAGPLSLISAYLARRHFEAQHRARLRTLGSEGF
ncbi:hypothetical protein [Paracoccus albus]|uniref:hypothetical protein n=1 Tax=Paracoccus albus TaxID=3017784 RepID=UPI0022F0383D|nr:hypothetical protein [Paracoccus albus]WBU60812.1 hypothetical protein PAF20_02485 [Paracoccus albus]